MSSFVAGPWGGSLLLFLALGLVLQLAIGAMVGLRRPVPAFAALVFPLLFALGGLAATIAAVEDAMAGLWNATDPAWAPWFALDDRARIAVPAAVAGGGAALLAVPVAFGAAVAAVRARATVARGRALAVGVGGLVAGAVVGGGGLAAVAAGEGAGAALLPVLGGLGFLVCALAAGAPARPRDLPAAAIGMGALLVGAPGLALAAWGGVAAGAAEALGDYSAPVAAMEAVVAATERAGTVGRIGAAVALGFVGTGALPALARDWRRVDPAHGLELFAGACLAGLVALAAGWAGARERVLTALAGGHAADVLQHAVGYDVPRAAPLPTRVLVGDAATPRWVAMRPRGGVERLPIAGGLDIVGPAILRGDGLMLAPSLPLEDFYLALFESGAGEVALVGCAPAPAALAAAIRRDPLLAVGRCGAFPLVLRVTTRLEDPRVLIVLKDRLVDDGGDIVPIAEVKDIAGRDVIVRGQADATVADLVALAGALAPAGRVFLGHGVTVEGDDLPIGVDPGLRIRGVAAAVGATP